jgi:hydroxyacylglutathione hydrolase
MHKSREVRTTCMVTNLAAGVQAFTSNAFLVEGERTVLVDAGANFDAAPRISAEVEDLDAVILTHRHPDHVENVADVRDAFDVATWGFDASDEHVDHEIEDDGTVKLGDHEYRALHTPGHEPHHLCFYSEAASTLFAGDLVFQNGSFGRTDLEGGDRPTLVESIERVQEAVDEDLAVVYPGHGPAMTDAPYEAIELSLQMARTR